MKKIYINNLNEKELEKIFNINKKLQDKIFESVCQNNIDYQNFLSTEFFGNNFFEYLKINDNYSSFFITIKNTIKFFENLNITNSDYLSEDDSKEYIKLYKKAKKYYNYLDRCSFYSDNYYKNENLLEETCEEILKILEKELHLLEDINYNEVLDYSLILFHNHLLHECLKYFLNPYNLLS